ncbi:DUF6603 domain-containing protein [Methyloterricola oryzae]|uniref:DUF6603 domain-containing protein n=1 Tax=Methyloterricola oryzae TaxID=1495050 RepID=UPI000A839BB2|nr:DUF6603 domain-containing protein [Methyloterricola oryzae]
MASELNFVQGLLSGATDFTGWAEEVLADAEAREALLKDLGLEGIGSSVAPHVPDDLKQRLKAFGELDHPQLTDYREALQDMHAVLECFREMLRVGELDDVAFLEETFDFMLNVLASSYARDRAPKVYFIAQVIQFAFDNLSHYGEGDNSFTRAFWGLVGLFGHLLTGPGDAHWELVTEEEAGNWSFGLRILAGLLVFFDKLGPKIGLGRAGDLPTIDVLYGWDSLPQLWPKPADASQPPRKPIADSVSGRMLTVRLWNQSRDDLASADEAAAATLSLALVPQDQGGRGLFISLGGDYRTIYPINDRWELVTKLDGRSNLSVLLSADHPSDLAGPDLKDNAIVFGIRSRPKPDGTPLLALPDAEGTHLAIGQWLSFVSVNGGQFEIQTLFQDCSLQLDTSKLDGFLSSLIPGGTQKTDFSFGAGWSTRRGFFTTGQLPSLSPKTSPAGQPKPLALAKSAAPVPEADPFDMAQLESLAARRDGRGVEIPLLTRKSLPGLTIDETAIRIRMRGSSEEPAIAVAAELSLTASIGPVIVHVEDLGLQFDLARFKDTSRANLHFAHLDLDLSTPTAIGLLIDTPQIRGGGFLKLDADAHQYAGMFDLTLSDLTTVKAIGLLNTRLPDGSRGYSLVVIITAQGFAPIQLGMGFTLTGIGGLLGIHRSARTEQLREGIRNGTLGSVLFPQDPIRQAARILSDLGRVFPPVRGRHAFGPMVEISWGTPRLLSLQLAILLELPEPVRLLVLGRLAADLPSADHSLVRLRMDAIGLVDFQRDSVSLDATLYDSRILDFVLTGDMALRAQWGRQPTFLLAVGGFNPRFLPPADFPRLGRLALSLGDTGSLRLRFEAYLALTSNTVQFGAAVDLRYHAGKLELAGHLGFDALFQFEPFAFVADLGAMVVVKYRGYTLLGIKLDMTVSGPAPWFVRGTARFKILFFSKSVDFSHRFGHQAPPPLPPAIDVLPLLVQAAADRRNWSTALPAGVASTVSFAVAAGEDARVHPLAAVSLHQRVVPLRTHISRFGNSPLAGGPQRFDLEARSGAAELRHSYRQDAFAPAQFNAMSDDEKLSSPAFAQYDAGLALGDGDVSFGELFADDAGFDYETLIIDPSRPAGTPAPKEKGYALLQANLDALIDLGAAGQAAARRRAGLSAAAGPAGRMAVRR